MDVFIHCWRVILIYDLRLTDWMIYILYFCIDSVQLRSQHLRQADRRDALRVARTVVCWFLMCGDLWRASDAVTWRRWATTSFGHLLYSDSRRRAGNWSRQTACHGQNRPTQTHQVSGIVINKISDGIHMYSISIDATSYGEIKIVISVAQWHTEQRPQKGEDLGVKHREEIILWVRGLSPGSKSTVGLEECVYACKFFLCFFENASGSCKIISGKHA